MQCITVSPPGPATVAANKVLSQLIFINICKEIACINAAAAAEEEEERVERIVRLAGRRCCVGALE